MSKIYIIFNSVVFRRVFIIFIVGFVSRFFVNFVFDVNVFKEFTTIISLVYYGFMALFSEYVCKLPSISLEVFKISSIKKAISMIVSNKGYEGKITLSGTDLSSKQGDNKIGVSKLGDKKIGSNFFFAGDSRKVNKSAGITGLYSNGDNTHNVNTSSRNSENIHEFFLPVRLDFRGRFDFRGRLLYK